MLSLKFPLRYPLLLKHSLPQMGKYLMYRLILHLLFDPKILKILLLLIDPMNQNYQQRQIAPMIRRNH